MKIEILLRVIIFNNATLNHPVSTIYREQWKTYSCVCNMHKGQFADIAKMVLLEWWITSDQQQMNKNLLADMTRFNYYWWSSHKQNKNILKKNLTNNYTFITTNTDIAHIYPLKVFSKGLSICTPISNFLLHLKHCREIFLFGWVTTKPSRYCNQMSFSTTKNQGLKPNTNAQTHPSCGLRFWVLV